MTTTDCSHLMSDLTGKEDGIAHIESEFGIQGEEMEITTVVLFQCRKGCDLKNVEKR